MPTYEYRCSACRHEFEQYQSIKDKPLKKCPACGKAALERLIGMGAAVIFKGGGFYQTDYRSEAYTKAKQADTPATGDAAAAKPETKPEPKPDTKPEAKPSSKPESKSDAKPAAKSESKPGKDTASGKKPKSASSS